MVVIVVVMMMMMMVMMMIMMLIPIATPSLICSAMTVLSVTEYWFT